MTWPATDTGTRLRMSDRAVVRLATVLQRVWPRVQREPAGSPLRRRLLQRALRVGWALTGARRVDDLGRFYHADVVVLAGKGLPPDLGPSVHGWDTFAGVIADVFFGGPLRWEPLAFLDFGGAGFGARVRVDMTGRASGLDVSTEFLSVYEVRDGRVARQWMSGEESEIDAWLAQRRAELETASD